MVFIRTSDHPLVYPLLLQLTLGMSGGSQVLTWIGQDCFSEEGGQTIKSCEMGSNDKLLLRWNDFERNIGSAFYDLKEEKDFADVTLACADGQVESHKVILAASSPFFKRVLKKNPHSHPLFYLKGINFSDVEAVLEFIHHGEVNVEEANLNTFFGVAEELEVKGLVPSRAAFPSDLSSIGYPRVSPTLCSPQRTTAATSWSQIRERGTVRVVQACNPRPPSSQSRSQFQGPTSNL